MGPNLQPKIYKSPVVAWNIVKSITRLDGFTSNIYVIFTVLPDSMGSNGDQYFNATFSSEPPVSDFQPFNVS
jgi:hypothetical protein